VELLLIEDDRELSGLLTRLLSGEGHRVDAAYDGQAGLHRGLTRPYDVIVLDRGLPVVEGLDLLAGLRRNGVDTPVLVLTARGTVADRVAGLDAGAEDYLVKPFEVDELLARLRALVRRGWREHAESVPWGAARLDLAASAVRRPDGGEVALSPRELALLRLLAGRPGRTYSRDEIRDQVFPETASASIVDTYVHYVRRKVGPESVRTVRGVGYRLGTA
jgi:two-component system, OmpR family, response regulator QseB